MLQAPPRKWDLDRLKFFCLAEHEAEIEAMAVGLSHEEVLAYYGITPQTLNDPELAYDKWFFTVCYNRGLVKGKHRAVAGLFKAVENANPHASLSYLLRFADKWEPTVEDESNSRIRGFRIVLDGE